MKITYRPEIDGLRAISVVAVILYHAQITILGHQPFQGGFIGVDIFFVISGYLITSIILKELVTTGSFSFKHFYERRILRILPILLFVMLVSLPFAWMYLLPNNFVDFSKSILYSLGFSSNFYFHYSGQEYGAENGLLKPFLHTWTLSVEEQFYILFPIVLLIIFKYFRKYLIQILILGFILSLGLADWGSRNHPSFNFYVLPTRGWELLAGSILAHFEITKGKRSENKMLNLVLPSIGLLLIGHSVLFFNDEMFHPSFYTLSPIIGVCLIIWFSNKDELITKILSTKLFVGVGLISYSLYLWHYPIFAFARYIEYFEKNLILLLLLIFSLSIISFRYEKKFRYNQIKSGYKLIFFLTISLILINLFLLNKIKSDSKKYPEFILNNPDITSIGRIYKLSGCWYGCKIDNNNKKSITIIGDSHAHSLVLDLKDRIIQKNYNLTVFAAGENLFKKTKNNNYNNLLKEKILKINNSIIIFSHAYTSITENTAFDNKEGGIIKAYDLKSFYQNEKEKEMMLKHVKSTLEKSSLKNKIIIVYPVPEVGWNVPRKIINHFSKKNKKKKLSISEFITTSNQVYLSRNKFVIEYLDSIKGQNIHRVYPSKLFCNSLIKDRCIIHDSKKIYYYDDNHLSLSGSKIVNDLIMKEIEKIELKSN